MDIQEATSNVTDLVTKILGAFERYYATTSTLTSFLIIGCLGFPYAKHDSPKRRKMLVADLLAENPKELRIAHGECKGIVGLIASRYTEVIRGFPEIREELANAPVDYAIEVP